MTKTTTSIIKPTLACTRKRHRKIGFKEIEIIELPVGLGDNPGCRDGPPVSCCYENPQLRFKVCLDKFETYRPQRRSRRQLRLCKRLREKLLLKHGYSSEDISRATLEARKTRFDRILSSRTSSTPSPSSSTITSSSTSTTTTTAGGMVSKLQSLQQQHPNLFTPSWMIRRSSSCPSSTAPASVPSLPPALTTPPLPSMAFQVARTTTL